MDNSLEELSHTHTQTHTSYFLTVLPSYKFTVLQFHTILPGFFTATSFAGTVP